VSKGFDRAGVSLPVCKVAWCQTTDFSKFLLVLMAYSRTQTPNCQLNLTYQKIDKWAGGGLYVSTCFDMLDATPKIQLTGSIDADGKSPQRALLLMINKYLLTFQSAKGFILRACTGLLTKHEQAEGQHQPAKFASRLLLETRLSNSRRLWGHTRCPGRYPSPWLPGGADVATC
jgi:hypothetical protein